MTEVGAARASATEWRSICLKKRKGWFRQAYTILRKDIKAELRTRVALCAVGIFTFAALLLLALATESLRQEFVVDPRGVMRPAWNAPAKMGMLWVLLCFAAFSGLSHAFVHEEETGTALTLRLYATPEAVYAGKLLFNLLLLCGVALVVTPIYMAITGLPMGEPIAFLVLMLSGCLGLASTATIIAALTAKARGSGALYGAVGLPMLVVFLLLLLNAAGTLYMQGAPTILNVKNIGGALSFGVLIVAVSALLFNYIWED
ncbi:ABC-type transport system involved in cytochrome c biogenesis, permease component [Chthonomonas calidirosea]|uniref:heme exporter protein CcmB n=1 Tax=Chthonomonas calidirosea TaxID=454171 RepID=UPI0006DD4357|nr:ABC transporter permease [Chthonomonas calidirosea]CEK13708.1 ABC-type transport system involved in cytochrome c biogenesis, permease component [Chthonomonas calidirosea]